MRSVELRQKRGKLLERCGAILDVAEGARRELNQDEAREYQTAWDEARALRGDIAEAECRERGQSRNPGPLQEPFAAGVGNRQLRAHLGPQLANLREPLDPEAGMPDLEAPRGSRRDGGPGPLRGFTGDGREVRLLKPEHRLRDFGGPQGRSAGEYDGPGLGAILRGALTGRWPDGRSDETRTQTTGDLTLGGVLIPSPVAASVIDRARAEAVLVRAGSLTMPMEGSTLTLARIAGDPTPSWKQENQDIGVSDVTFDGLIATPRRLGVIVKSSVELFEDSPNVGPVVEATLAKALGLELDRVGLSGMGAAAEPLGIANHPDVQTIGSIAALADYADFSSAVQKVAEQNGVAGAVILSPRDFGTLDRLVDTTDQPLAAPASWNGLSKFVSTQARITLGAGAESEAFVGDFTKCLFAVRTELAIEASRQASDTGSSAFSKYQVWIRAVLRADFVVLQAPHFVYMSGITA